MVAKLGCERLTDFSIGKVKGNVLKRLHHAATTKPSQVTATLSTAILRLSLGKFLKVGTSLQQSIDRINLYLTLSFLLLGGLPREEPEDVLGMNIVAATLIVHPDHVDAELSCKRLAD